MDTAERQAVAGRPGVRGRYRAHRGGTAAPGSAADNPAPQISTFKPRSRAERQYSATASGCRCADRTSNSYAMPRLSSSSSAPCIRSRSDSEPTRIPTTGSDNGCRLARDVGTIARAVERDERRGLVRALAGGRERRPVAVTPRILPPFVTSVLSCSAVPAWKTNAPVASASSMPAIGEPASPAAGYDPAAITTVTAASSDACSVDRRASPRRTTRAPPAASRRRAA